MQKMKQIGVGILGFGTVGAGVADGLLKHRDVMAKRLGVDIVLRKIADLDITTDRGIQVPEGVLTTDAKGVLSDPEIDIVVETIGGTGIAKTFVLEALNGGKCVVTANKKLLAEHGREIFETAAKNDVDIYFGASVGGGIPIIRVLREGLAGNEIESIHGILNGTCNYILTRMENEGLPFESVLKDAQKLGYAEANPSLDIDGFDTATRRASSPRSRTASSLAWTRCRSRVSAISTAPTSSTRPTSATASSFSRSSRRTARRWRSGCTRRSSRSRTCLPT